MSYESEKTWAFLCTMLEDSEIHGIASHCAMNSIIDLEEISELLNKSIDDIKIICQEILDRIKNWNYVLDPIETLPKHKYLKPLDQISKELYDELVKFDYIKRVKNE